MPTSLSRQIRNWFRGGWRREQGATSCSSTGRSYGAAGGGGHLVAQPVGGALRRREWFFAIGFHARSRGSQSGRATAPGRVARGLRQPGQQDAIHRAAVSV